MRRIAVFAHYDSNNMIADYVTYFIEELRNVVDKIVFVSDSNVENKELKKIDKYVDNFIIGRHGEYDFGSYKRGYLFLEKNKLLDSCDELIFVNDSCYAPLYPFNEMFDKMSPQNFDFWGAVANSNKYTGYVEHIQSYFIVFKQNVFKSNVFKEFIQDIKKEENKDNIVLKYECGLTNILSSNNFTWNVYSEISKRKEDSYLYFYKSMIKNERNPFLKRSIILYRARTPYWGISKLINKYTNYNYDYIQQDYLYNKSKINLKIFLILLYKLFIRIPFYSIKYMFK